MTAAGPNAHSGSAALDEAKARLRVEQGAAAARIAALERDIASIVESASGGATDDEHDAEGTTIAFERAQAMALLEETRSQVEALDSALARVEAGSYGRCESCGQDIAPERLVARPAAARCITCASRLGQLRHTLRMGYDAPSGFIEDLPRAESGSQHSTFHLRRDCPRIKDQAEVRAVDRPYSAARCRHCAGQPT